MATGRMLRQTISTCEELADCSLVARLLFTWGLPHTSDWGVLTASPRKLQATVFPLNAELLKEIPGAIEELVAAGLWQRFEVDGVEYLWYPTFDKYQDIRKRTSSSRSGLPAPPTEMACRNFPELPATSGKFREVSDQEKGREGKRREEKRRENGAPRGRAREADQPAPTPEVPVPAPEPDTPLPEEPGDFAHMEAGHSTLVSAARTYFAGTLSPQAAQAFALAAQRATLLPSETLTPADLENALRAADGSGPLAEEVRFPDRWLARLRRERDRATSARASPAPGDGVPQRTSEEQRRADRQAAMGMGRGLAEEVVFRERGGGVNWTMVGATVAQSYGGELAAEVVGELSGSATAQEVSSGE